jgi:formylglycine-generating enzyme required for sulfatase activity
MVGLLAKLWLGTPEKESPARWDVPAKTRGSEVVEKELGKGISIPTYHALIIGINKYKDPKWQTLRQAREDAENVSRELVRRYGFKRTNVTELFDTEATRDAIYNNLRRSAECLGENDALLIYFSGHGFHDSMTKKGYWVTTEARRWSEQRDPAFGDWFQNADLKGYLACMKARQVLVVSDSCFSGALFNKGDARTELGQRENAWLAKAIMQPTRYCITSGDLVTVPDESPFARKFVSILQYPRKRVFGASEVFVWIRDELAAASSPDSPIPQPTSGTLVDSVGSPNSDFVFLACYEETAPTKVSPPPSPPPVPPLPPTPPEPVVPQLPFGPKAGDVKVVPLGNGIKMEMVWISSGEFTMGCPSSESSRDSDESQHRVTLTKGFWMGKHEVTEEVWEKVMGSKSANSRGPANPVVHVSWNKCQAFIGKLNASVQGGGFRLPTEAEWEYACRAGTTTAFYYGDSLDVTMANFNGKYAYGSDSEGECRQTTMPVGAFRPNAWGIYDMHGNVWEWCQDWYGDYPTFAVSDPTGPTSGTYRVARGGDWKFNAGYCRSAKRDKRLPDGHWDILGFRLARTP